MKRIIAFALTLILALTLICSCGKSEETKDNKTDGADDVTTDAKTEESAEDVSAEVEETAQQYGWSIFLIEDNEVEVLRGFDEVDGIYQFIEFNPDGTLFMCSNVSDSKTYIGSYEVSPDGSMTLEMGREYNAHIDNEYSFEGSDKTIPVLKITYDMVTEYYANHDLFIDTFGEITDNK